VKTRHTLAILLVLAAGASVAASENVTARRTRPAATTTTSTPSSQTFSSEPYRLSFTHPPEWAEYPYQWASSFQDSVVYLANLPLHDPCHTETNGSSITGSCGYPLETLRPGGVLITWTNVGFPRPPSESEVPNANTTIARQPARVVVSRPGGCADIGSDETIVVDIARPGGNHFDMRACLRGPGLIANTRLVRSMLRSVRLGDVTGYCCG
jgi:hypothetical protein